MVMHMRTTGMRSSMKTEKTTILFSEWRRTTRTTKNTREVSFNLLQRHYFSTGLIIYRLHRPHNNLLCFPHRRPPRHCFWRLRCLVHRVVFVLVGVIIVIVFISFVVSSTEFCSCSFSCLRRVHRRRRAHHCLPRGRHIIKLKRKKNGRRRTRRIQRRIRGWRGRGRGHGRRNGKVGGIQGPVPENING